VIMMASTPSLKASSRPLFMPAPSKRKSGNRSLSYASPNL
jgi:hypothetical protein